MIIIMIIIIYISQFGPIITSIINQLKPIQMRSDHMGGVEKRSVRLIIETKVGPEGGGYNNWEFEENIAN